MKGISKNADDLCVQALMAGNDMLLVPRNLKKSLESVMRAVKRIATAYHGAVCSIRFSESVHRVCLVLQSHLHRVRIFHLHF